MKVLVADDSKMDRVILDKFLSSWGYQVVLATDGTEAWKVLNDPDPPQIAILDWLMPGKTGVEICAECQKTGLFVYRILLTAKQEAEDMMYALDQGAHDFQSKPISPGILRSRIAVGQRLVQAMQDVMRSERLAAIGSLITGVAHHFNNLNMPILMYASSILKSSDLDPDIRKKVEKIERASEQAGSLTEKLMSIAGNKIQKKKPADLNQLVTGAIEINSIYFEKNGITVDTDLNPIPNILIDKNDIHHLIMNLLGNASHALIASPEKKIMAKTGVENKQVFLKIIDTGCGIEADKLQKIFSPFYSKKGEFADPDSPLNKVKGVGIGLYASRNIAVDHGGEITVESRMDHGSTFSLCLPVAK